MTAKIGRHQPRRDQLLTPREKEVLLLVAGGKMNAAIAADLRISGETVKAHLRHINKALETRNRTHAVATAIRHGLIE